MDLLEFLSKYINNEFFSNDFSFTNQFINCTIEQSLQTLLFPVTKNKLYKKYYVSWAVKQEEFFRMQDEITRLFNENNISHFYFKGAIISKLYDDPSVRTRGDIDLYLDYKQMKLAEDILKASGYTVSKNQDCVYHLIMEKNSMNVELHFRLFDDGEKKEWINYFKNPFDYTFNETKCLYKLDDTNHFLYVLCHFAHHLRTGAGIRNILDFYYMFKKCNLDFDLLHNGLHKLKLETLYENILNVLYLLTNIKFDDFEIKDCQFFIDYMSSYGIYGYQNNETTHNASLHSNKFKYFIYRIFLINKPYRISKYPKLGSHWYLYPICLIKHWVYLITHKLGSFFKFLFGKNKNQSLYNKLGI